MKKIIKNIWIGVLSLLVATICWFISKFVVLNFIVGYAVNNNSTSDASRAGLASMGGILQLGLWLFMLWGIRKFIKSRNKKKLSSDGEN